MRIAICSFSFHRLLAAGKQDMFRYIADCRKLGCTQLDPWNAHLAEFKKGDDIIHAGHNPDQSHHLTAVEDAYIARVKVAADKAALPFGCIAVDGAHIYDKGPAVRRANRARAYRWIAIAEKLGAEQMRIDAGGSEQMPDDEFNIICEGYTDLLKRTRAAGIQLLIENHWGPSPIPGNLIKILDALPGLGLLFDSFNWKFGHKTEGWLECAKYAKATHMKTFAFTRDGQELTENIPACIQLLQSAGYKGAWGVESCPLNGKEIEAARKTIALIRKSARK